MRMLICVVAVVVAGCGGGSPTAPTPPTPSARLVTVAQDGPDVTFPNWPCDDTGGQCRYRFQARNEGPDCARAVRGTLRLTSAGGTVLAQDEWALEAARVVGVQEVVTVEDGTISASAILGVSDGQATVTFAFEAVRCD